MKGWNMFSEIKQYKALGFNKSQVERALNINYKTVQKYFDMDSGEYSRVIIQSKNRHKKIDIYKDDIFEWITDFRDMSSTPFKFKTFNTKKPLKLYLYKFQ